MRVKTMIRMEITKNIQVNISSKKKNCKKGKLRLKILKTEKGINWMVKNCIDNKTLYEMNNYNYK